MADNTFGVRRAEAADLAPLIESAVTIFLDGALQEVSRAKVAGLVQRCVDRDGAIAGIIDGPAGIEASIGMVVEEFDYSAAQHLAVKFLGVHPAFRRTNHGARLMSFAAWAQEAMGVPLFMELSTTEELVGKMHLLQRLIPQVGARFCWGAVPEGAYNQRRVGDDPLKDRVRSRRSADARPTARPAAA